MAEYIDRNKIRWFSCDWENRCDEYNDDCSKCPHGECEHDQVVSIPLADVIEREKIDKAIEVIKQEIQNGTIKINSGNEKLFDILEDI